LSIDQGTTNSKAALVAEDGRVLATGSAPVRLSLPAPGWVEQDAEDLWSSVVRAVISCLTGTEAEVVGVTISNQRESVLAWRRSSGTPIGPVLGWQDRRTAEWCSTSLPPQTDAVVRERTGLRVDPMFSAPKLNWLIRSAGSTVPLSDLCVGTVDSWLVWRLTGGAVHACDAGNASRTLLFDVAKLAWSSELLNLFDIPADVLPEVRASNGGFGTVRGLGPLPDGVPILAVMADSHAALYGQGCTQPGMAKATYGTGSSVMTPTGSFVAGDSPVPSTLAWLTDVPTYAREGNILSSGATLAWTADILGLTDVSELVALAAEAADSGGVQLVPAFSGLGAPHWDRSAQALMIGMSQATSRAQIARAAVDAVAHQVCDVVEEIEAGDDLITVFRADGGATASALLMQTQADLLRRPVEVSDVPELSAVGAAQLGWRTLNPGASSGTPSGDGGSGSAARVFRPLLDEATRSQARANWRDAVARSRHLAGSR
jgi:glycerol kinase